MALYRKMGTKTGIYKQKCSVSWVFVYFWREIRMKNENDRILPVFTGVICRNVWIKHCHYDFGSRALGTGLTHEMFFSRSFLTLVKSTFLAKHLIRAFCKKNQKALLLFKRWGGEAFLQIAYWNEFARKKWRLLLISIQIEERFSCEASGKRSFARIICSSSPMRRNFFLANSLV